jgi:hypothetical protein
VDISSELTYDDDINSQRISITKNIDGQVSILVSYDMYIHIYTYMYIYIVTYIYIYLNVTFLLIRPVIS